jgi:hypothetical protein
VATDAAEADNFGSSVALAGATALIGARSKDDMGGAYLFGWHDTAWLQSTGLSPTQREAHDEIGESVALSERFAVVGSNHGASGSVYVFGIKGVAAP